MQGSLDESNTKWKDMGEDWDYERMTVITQQVSSARSSCSPLDFARVRGASVGLDITRDSGSSIDSHPTRNRTKMS